MVGSKAATVQEYLKELPAERRAVIAKVRAVVRKNLPKGYQEKLGYGMICYEVPLKRYPDTCNGQPLCYIGLAAQKHHNAIYLTSVYQDAGQAKWLKDQFKKANKKLDMGKSCVRFKKLDDLPLDAIGKVVAATTPEQHIARYEASRKT